MYNKVKKLYFSINKIITLVAFCNKVNLILNINKIYFI